MAVVVVGVDGSPQSLEACRLAADEARCRSARLRAVYVYEPVRVREVEAAAAVAAAGMWTGSGKDIIADAYRHEGEERAEASQHAVSRLRTILAPLADDLAGVTVEHIAIDDRHPSAGLLRAAGDADLLVVGSRGLGGFSGLLLGSVSQQCVQHADCPVLVARPPRR